MRSVAVALAMAAAVQGAPILPARSATPPSLRVQAAAKAVTAESFGGEVWWLDLGVWAEAVGGAFHLRVARPRYSEPIAVDQVDPVTGDVLRSLPGDLLDGWRGLRRFFRVTFRDRDGRVAARAFANFCPNSGERNRTDDQGPATPSYPDRCSSHPLTKGMVWGIDEGWATNAVTIEEPLRLAPGRYEATVRITGEYRQLLDISGADGRTNVVVRVRRYSEDDFFHADARSESEPATGEPAAAVPIVTDPDPATLPDLRSLPAFGFTLFRDRGREELGFAATEWNRGPAPLVVEGFRRPDSNIMDAYQYFYDGDVAVGKAPVGTFKYHGAPGHHHWHFQQFATYELLDSSREKVVRSKKSSWCLVPTDAIDLTVPGADWTPWEGLHTSCGHPGSLWIREVLQVGWGDTYYQAFGGQSFDVTDLPNGIYFVKVTVNPLGALYETKQTNNTQLRRVRITGQAGNRRVVVPPWRGIDTEGAFGDIEFF